MLREGGGRFGLSRKRPPWDSTKTYSPERGLWSAHLCCEKGLDLVYRERDHPGIVQKRTAQGGLLLGWVKDDPLSQQRINLRQYQCKPSTTYPEHLLAPARMMRTALCRLQHQRLVMTMMLSSDRALQEAHVH